MSGEPIKLRNLVAILLLWITLSDFSLLTPALDSLDKAFTSTSMSVILFSNTITGLLIVVFGVITGSVIEKIGYRRTAIGGLLIATIGGCFPFFITSTDSYTHIVISRIIVGIGIGAVTPVGGTLISKYYTGKRRARYFGYGNLIFVGGGVLYQLAGGFLASMSWRYTFLGYLLAVIPMIVAILFLPEPPKVTEEERLAEKSRVKSKMPLIVFAYVAIEVFLATLDIPALFLTSTVVSELGMGTSALAGVLTSFYQLSGIFAGLVFTIALAIFKKRIFAFAAILCSLSYVVMHFSTAPVPYAIGMFLLGIGDLLFFTSVQYGANNATPSDRLATTNGLMQAAMNMGAFLASYYLTAVQALFPSLGTQGPFISSTILLFTLGVVCFFLPFKHVVIKKNDETENEGGEAGEEALRLK